MLLILTSFFVGIATLSAYEIIEDWGSTVSGLDFVLPAVVILVMVAAVYTINRYLKNVPIFIIDASGITIGADVYYFSDVTHIKLTGKQTFQYFLADAELEGAVLQFRNGKTLYIYDRMYANIGAIKTLIEQSTQRKHNTDRTLYKGSNTGDKKKYAGNMPFSMRGSMYIGTTLLLASIFVSEVQNNEQPNMPIALGIFIIFWTIVNAWLMHYFEMSDQFFVVRNHLFFWKRHKYELSEIREIVFESQGKRPHGVRVITKSFKNELYPAGTLRDKTWLKLNAELKRRNIRVRNECYFGE